MSHAKYLLGWGLSLLALTTACSDGDDLISATVPYQLGAGMTCAEAKIVSVRVSLGHLRDQKFEAPCDDSGQILLEGVENQKWPVTVEGVDAQGTVTMSSSVSTPAPVIDFSQDAMVTSRIILASVPAQVQLRWDLGFGDCASLKLKGFMVQAWDQSLARMLMSGMIECNAPTVEQNYRKLPDPEGRIIGSELKALTIQPMLNDGKSFGTPIRVELAAPPGPGYVVRAGIKCAGDAGACTADPNGVSVSQK